jgi:hypothetical protein
MIAVLEQKRGMKVRGIHADHFSGNIHTRRTQLRILEGSIAVRRTRELVLEDKQPCIRRTSKTTGTNRIPTEETVRNSITSCMPRKRNHQH